MIRYLKLLLAGPKSYFTEMWNGFSYLRKYPTLKLGTEVVLKDVVFEGNNYIATKAVCRECSFGRYSYVGENSKLRDVEVGAFVSIGPNVAVGLGEHPINRFSTHPVFYSSKGQVGKTFVSKNTFDEYNGPTKIGHDAWIGANVVIRGGVRIGVGAIVATGAIVSKDVEDYSIVGGVPAKHIKYRLSEELRKQVKSSQWWLKDDLWLRDNMNSIIE